MFNRRKDLVAWLVIKWPNALLGLGVLLDVVVVCFFELPQPNSSAAASVLVSTALLGFMRRLYSLPHPEVRRCEDSLPGCPRSVPR